MLYVIGALLFIIAILAIYMKVISPGRADPIVGTDGNELAGSISEIQKIQIGGVDQYLIIRGTDASRPVMLFLHGGPGSPETIFMKHYNQAIENNFVMVYWEQRGAGKSYTKDIPSESMTFAQMVTDTREVAEYLAMRFGQEKVFLMGHSWGSLLGILTAHEHPECFHAFFGVGQVAQQYRAERISLEWVLDQARERQDDRSVKALAALSFPDSLADSNTWIKYLMRQRNYVNRFGGGITRETTGMWPLVKMVLKAREYTMSDKLNFMKASMFSLEHLWEGVMRTDLFHAIDSMQVPVFIFQGKYDYQTPHVVARAFYEQLRAPKKDFFTFGEAAHSPNMEDPTRFNAIISEIAASIQP